mgnify:CR=1 FL=1
MALTEDGWRASLDGTIVWGIYAVRRGVLIRRLEGWVYYHNDGLCVDRGVGPFPTLEAAKVAYRLLQK